MQLSIQYREGKLHPTTHSCHLRSLSPYRQPLSFTPWPNLCLIKSAPVGNGTLVLRRRSECSNHYQVFFIAKLMQGNVSNNDNLFIASDNRICKKVLNLSSKTKKPQRSWSTVKTACRLSISIRNFKPRWDPTRLCRS